MKRLMIILGVVMLAAGCSSFDKKTPGLTPAVGTETPVKDVKLSTDFTDQGVKIFYNLSGAVDKVEVTGIAPAWRGNVEIVAEADAMDKLVKFVHGQSVNSERRNRIITKTLDRARDNTLNRFRTVDGTASFDAREVSKELDRDDSAGVPKTGDDGSANERNNTSRRIADRVEQGLVEATTTITAQGRLTGVRKIRDRVIQDGRVYVAVYQWSPQDQDTSDLIRNRMR
jgi:hypothetical protein